MISEKVIICNKLGLHARAASVFVKTAMQFASTVNVTRGEQSANGKSIMSMMLLEATTGTEVELKADGEDEQPALQALVELIERRFDEDE